MKCLNCTGTNQVVQCFICYKPFCENTCLQEHGINHYLYSDFDEILKTRRDINNGLPKEREPKIFDKPVPQEKLTTTDEYSASYIENGEFDFNPKFDSFYDFHNFDFVRNGKKFKSLGNGAYGDVFLAKHKVDDQKCAIKMMNKAKIEENNIHIDIIKKEIEIHSRLIHPYIIRLKNYYENKNSIYIVMDYAKNGNLFHKISKNKNGLNENDTFKYFIQTCSAIHFLHENNLVHRDIKPENLLLDDNNNIKLCDFGWCDNLGNNALKSTFCGTFEFMAPEIIQQKKYDKKVDIWALGILLYELLHGCSPFKANEKETNPANFQDIVFSKILINEFELKMDLSENVKDLIRRKLFNLELLQPYPEDRISLKEVFFHPWILEKYNELKDNLNKKEVSSILKKDPMPISKSSKLFESYKNKVKFENTIQTSSNAINISNTIKNEPKPLFSEENYYDNEKIEGENISHPLGRRKFFASAKTERDNHDHNIESDLFKKFDSDIDYSKSLTKLKQAKISSTHYSDQKKTQSANDIQEIPVSLSRAVKHQKDSPKKLRPQKNEVEFYSKSLKYESKNESDTNEGSFSINKAQTQRGDNRSNLILKRKVSQENLFNFLIDEDNVKIESYFDSNKENIISPTNKFRKKKNSITIKGK